MDESIFDRQLDEQLCFRLYRASNGINKMYGRALKIFQLTFPQYLVLLALWDNDGLPIMTIGSQTGMGIGTLNPILKRMAENEWIEKSQHPTDKRTMLISLSAKAKESKQPINQAILAEMISCNFEGMDLPELMLQLANLQQRLDTINENK
ncbi:MarR family winged helix-turn-helix transcriptional regulator [Jeotgalibaca porci]|uniref:MarR family transcriptional regulator n=3 Tax=Jeotgalibaca porci TaxID=1868793 RepID=A0A6G7WH78_9LACT|nr:MarR family transcriptional regulator [Jeotgalibaca porci]QIK51548.1 MarR family transcriptional regulator [Jeotgalibaca porci]